MNLRRLWLHAVLLAILALECGVAFVRHQTDAQLRQALTNGTPQQKVNALFILTNRGTPAAMDRPAIQRLTQADEPLVREWTMTANFTRLGPTAPQEGHIMSLDHTPEATRCRFLLEFRPVVGATLSLADLRRFLDALHDDS